MVLIEKDKFKKWLELNYNNANTIRQYLLAEIRFLKQMNVYVDKGRDYDIKEGSEFTQGYIDQYLIWHKSSTNPFYKGFIKAYLECYDPDGLFRFKVPRNRSKQPDVDKEVKFKEHEDIESYIETLSNSSNKVNRQVGLMVRLYFETGLRAFELIAICKPEGQGNKNKWGWNINERVLWGIGKGNKPFKVRFSKHSADLLLKHLSTLPQGRKPFSFYKSDGNEYKNPYNMLIRTLKKECGITPHQVRHSLGHHLRVDLKWDIEQVRAKLRHKKLETTQIYSIATSQEIAKKEDEELFKD